MKSEVVGRARRRGVRSKRDFMFASFGGRMCEMGNI